MWSFALIVLLALLGAVSAFYPLVLVSQAVRAPKRAAAACIVSNLEIAQERREHTKKYLRHVLSFERHRSAMDNLWQENSSGKLEEVKSVEPELDSSMRQSSRTGDPVANIIQLYEAAADAQPIFGQILQQIAYECGIPVIFPDHSEHHGHAPVTCGLTLAPLKSQARAAEKAQNDYGKRDPGPDVAWLYDIVRAMFVCDSEQQILNVLTALESRWFELDIVRLQNRFRKPTPAGFRDLLLNIRLQSVSCNFICEVQIHHVAMLNYGKQHGSHSHYEFFREYFKGSTESVQKRIELASSMGQYAADTDLDTIVRDLVRSTDITRLVAFKDLAELLGELEDAVIAERRVLEIYREHSAGEESADVATSLNNLAELLRAQGKYDEAKPLCQQSLAINRKVSALMSAFLLHRLPVRFMATNTLKSPRTSTT
jgi:tetratricopeptide (TPR) repeat protein